MSVLTLKELAKEMADIDFTMLFTHAGDGRMAGRPMSNNRDVEYDGDAYFYAYDDSRTVTDISNNPKVGMSLQGNKGLLGKPPIMIAVQGEAELIRDKAVVQQHWNKDLDRWFEQGVDTPGVVLIKVHATRLHYWHGMEEREIPLTEKGAL